VSHSAAPPLIALAPYPAHALMLAGDNNPSGKDLTLMKTKLIAGLAALATLVAVPAFAQAPAAAPAAAAGKFSVETTPIGTIIANPAAKAVLEKEVPALSAYYDQIKEMTLAQLAPMSQGAIDDTKLKAIQAGLDQVK
jgi:hypothetical protein